MTSPKFTTRKSIGPRATPADIIRSYQTYRPCYGDDLGEFLSHYHRHWSDAHAHGVTGYDGIVRLVVLLPPEWQGWAWDLTRDYLFRAGEHHDVVGDFPEFLATIQTYYVVHRRAPLGPYIRPGDLVAVGASRETTQPPAPYHAPPVAPSPPRTTTLDRRSRDEFEAGPSQIREREQTPFAHFRDPYVSSDDEGPTGARAEEHHLAVEGDTWGKAPMRADVAEPPPSLADLRRIVAELQEAPPIFTTPAPEPVVEGFEEWLREHTRRMEVLLACRKADTFAAARRVREAELEQAPVPEEQEPVP